MKKCKLDLTKTLILEKLNKSDRKKIFGCIKRFFYDKLPVYTKLSNRKSMIKKFKGKTVSSLGVEGALESFIGLFEDGRFKLDFVDTNNFSVYTVDNNKKITVLYRVEKGKTTK